MDDRRVVACSMGVTEKTVRNWMKASMKPPKRLGRPPYSKEEKYRALRAVGRQRRLQGKKAGWRTINEALCGTVPTPLVQRTLKRWKKRDRRRKRMHIAKSRISVTVKALDVIWTQDGTHLGRLEDGRAVIGEVVKDRGSLQTLSVSAGPEATSSDVIDQIEMTKVERGVLPLVWQSDNGPPYRSEETQNYLVQERIVPLPSRAHTPTDNGAAEIGIRELKEMSGLGKGVRLCSAREAALQLGKSAVLINEHRLRGSRGYVSANTLAEEMESWYTRIDRDQFYHETQCEVEKAVQDKTGNRARLAHRDAVLMVLKKYGLIAVERGGRTREALN